MPEPQINDDDRKTIMNIVEMCIACRRFCPRNGFASDEYYPIEERLDSKDITTTDLLDLRRRLV